MNECKNCKNHANIGDEFCGNGCAAEFYMEENASLKAEKRRLEKYQSIIVDDLRLIASHLRYEATPYCAKANIEFLVGEIKQKLKNSGGD